VTGEVERTRATYDAVSVGYHQRTQSLWPALIPHLDWFARGLGDDARVLDVGCGPGRDTRALRERGLAVLGLDLPTGQLKAGGLADVAVANMRSLPIKAGAAVPPGCPASAADSTCSTAASKTATGGGSPSAPAGTARRNEPTRGVKRRRRRARRGNNTERRVTERLAFAHRIGAVSAQ
jgi:hypothetical protein